MKPIPYGRQYIDEDDVNAVIEALQSDFMTQGPKIEEFEKALANYCGVKYAVVFTNGTAALHGAYFASGIKPGEKFITSPMTFVASANAGLYMGATPGFCDISMKDYNLDQEKLWDLVANSTKVITPVSFAGYSADLETLRAECDRRGIVLIQDAAHAIGSETRGEGFCKYAHMSMVSFHPVKHIATGEGGVILTDSEIYYKRLQKFRTHGITKKAGELLENHGDWYYEMQELGFNYRMTDMQCALGLSQLKKLDVSICRRNEIARRYNAELPNWLHIPPAPENGVHAYHLYPVLINEPSKRRAFYDYLHENGIKVQVHYIPVHYMPYYKERFGFKKGDFPVAEDFYAREVSLPMYPTLTDEQQSYVIEKIKGFDAR